MIRFRRREGSEHCVGTGVVRSLWVVALVIVALVAGSQPLQAQGLKDPLNLLEALEKRRQELDERAKRLEQREQELTRLEEKLDERMASLKKLRSEIQKDVAREKQVDMRNIKKLAKIYKGMKAQFAAAQLTRMESETAVRILKEMSEKSVSKILNKMDTQKAVQLSSMIGVTFAKRYDMEP